MMYPNITLKIENNVPTVIYSTEEGNNKDLIPVRENIGDLIIDLANNLNIKPEKEDPDMNELQALLQLSASGDERFIEKVPKIDTFKDKFGLTDFVKAQMDKAIENKDNFSEYGEVDTKILEELERNQNLDIFASLLEMIYNIIIAKVLVFAAELGIGTIILDDHDGFMRLQEKMASELSKVDIELQFEHNN